MKLNLKRPIVFFDIESTGLNLMKDRIVEISIIKIHPDQKEEVYTFRVNPEMPISAEATAIHGIKNEDVKNEPTFKERAPRIAELLKNSDIAGFNSNKFDIPLLAEEFYRVGYDIDLHRHKFVDVQNIYHKMERRTLSAAYKFYCDKDLENAHTAEADTRATYEVLMAQLDKYSNLANDVDKLSEFSKMVNNVDFAGRIIMDENGRHIFNFGKYKGEVVEKVLKKEPNYYTWMQENEFPGDTKRILTKIKLGMK